VYGPLFLKAEDERRESRRVSLQTGNVASRRAVAGQERADFGRAWWKANADEIETNPGDRSR